MRKRGIQSNCIERAICFLLARNARAVIGNSSESRFLFVMVGQVLGQEGRWDGAHRADHVINGTTLAQNFLSSCDCFHWQVCARNYAPPGRPPWPVVGTPTASDARPSHYIETFPR